MNVRFPARGVPMKYASLPQRVLLAAALQPWAWNGGLMAAGNTAVRRGKTAPAGGLGTAKGMRLCRRGIGCCR